MQEETPQENLKEGDNHPAPIDSSEKMPSKRLIVVLVSLVALVLIIGGSFFITKKEPLSTIDDKSPATSDTTKRHGGFNESASEDPLGESDSEDYRVYRVLDDVIYYYNREIPNADPSSFQELGDSWAKDKDNVYWEATTQTYLDPATVKVYPHIYVVDRSKVWVYGTGHRMKVEETDADPSTFSVISHGYGKDKNNIYYFAQKISSADVRSFTLLRGTDYPSSEGLASSWYAKDKDNVYYRSSTIPNADVKSFVYVGNDYARDKLHVYYRGAILTNADTNSFVLVDGYAKDTNHIFRGDKILNLAIDPASFEVVSGRVIRDSQRVYFQDYYADTYTLMQNVDASTFQGIGVCKCVEMSCGSYFRDKNTIYLESEPAESLDASSFQYLGVYWGAWQGLPYSVSYAKDKNSVYHSCGVNLENADPATFQDLEDGYAKDNNAVWYLADALEGADTNSFQALGEGYAKDKNNAYFAGAIIENVDAP